MTEKQANDITFLAVLGVASLVAGVILAVALKMWEPIVYGVGGLVVLSALSSWYRRRVEP